MEVHRESGIILSWRLGFGLDLLTVAAFSFVSHYRSGPSRFHRGDNRFLELSARSCQHLAFIFLTYYLLTQPREGRGGS